MGCQFSCKTSCGAPHSLDAMTVANGHSKEKASPSPRLTPASALSKQKTVMEHVSFSHGSGRMPMVGLGTWTAKDEEMEAALEMALQNGYRHIDTATDYHNEKVIGKVLEKWIKDGKVKREELFITTKLPVYGNRASDVEKWLNRSIDNLRCEYIDLYLIHVPFGFAKGESVTFDNDGRVQLDNDTDHVAMWKELEKQVEAGKAKAIGVSNFNQKQIQKLIVSAKILPANLQIENHIYLQQHQLVDFCHDNKITVTAYSPLGNPSLQGFFSKLGITKEIPSVLHCPEVVDISKRMKKSAAQVLLRYNIQRGIAVIPKSIKSERQKENIELFDFKLTEEDMKALRSLDRGEEGRIVRFEFFKGVYDHPEFPFKED
ncbi:aldo-keto reductase family 1 member B7 [Nilaparvata lugens]|uniref:aldo-keto reductase family 1 member B7 n=1 Tax=Nilaparvata lugens TaxID=108931 RepID=UPI000B9943C2|nr:aldo-keto reductase family 1 member B7 [Nilaparvata lugens]XP_039283143.1 aldo-keto reductase family 1 member B7 [Nilaparvata lugens]